MMGNKGSCLVQKLYELCKKSFNPTTTMTSQQAQSAAIQKLCTLLDSFTPADVGLKVDNSEDERGYGFSRNNPAENNLFSRPSRWAQPITYLHIHDCPNFTIGIFCLPTTAVIPLHDHPGMTVLSKILYGSLHVKAYDWVQPPCKRKTADTQMKLAKLTVDTVLTAPCKTAVLYPRSGGNIHCFTAVSSCAILDVLAPPYSKAAGRGCTYYHDYPFSTISEDVEIEGNEDTYAWIQEINEPDDFYTRQGTYSGPVVQV